MAPMTEERRKQLEQARQKAVEKRRQLGELARKEKAMRQKEIDDRLAKVEEFERSRQQVPSKPVDVPAPSPATAQEPRRRRKKPPPSPPTSSSSSEEEEESMSDDDIVEDLPPAPQAPKHKRPRTMPRLAADVAREELQRRIDQENYQQAFSSIFPGHRWY